MKYLKLFNQHSNYETYINGSDKVLPNVSYCENENEVHYNPWVETRVVSTFNVTSTSSATNIMNSSATSQFSEVEIDGVIQSSVASSYTFDTTGEHIIKYTIANPATIGNGAFQGCTNLTSITIPDSVTSIGFSAFKGCTGLTDITIPSNVTTIHSGAFQGCTGLTSIIIPNGVTSIGQSGFSECTNLTSITIGNGVTNIDTGVFYGCYNLASITSLATTAPIIQSNTFLSVKTGGTLTVPSGSTGYDVWMGTGNFYLGKYNWTKVEQLDLSNNQ